MNLNLHKEQWKIAKNGLIVIDGKDDVISECNPYSYANKPRHAALANAKLIANAPEMLAMLVETRTILYNAGQEKGLLYNKINETINKAI